MPSRLRNDNPASQDDVLDEFIRSGERAAAFNQFDNDRKAERTRLGMQREASIGRFPFKAPLGYLNVSSQNCANLIVDPERAPIIQKAFELYATGAETKASVIRTVTLLGLKTQAGRKLTPQTFEKLLRNPLYAGWIVVPAWNLRENGSFTPLVNDELFRRVQDVLDGKRVAVTAHQRNHPDFPLRVFLTCGECKTPLTGSRSKGRKSRYPCYRCRNSGCRAVNVRREALEKRFADLLRQLTPEKQYMRLFKEIVRQVWKQRQAASIAALRNVSGTLEALRERKNRVVNLFVDGRMDQDTYDQQVLRLDAEVQQAEQQLRDSDVEHMDVEAVLAFAERLVERPKELWLQSSLEQKQRLQRVFFLDGLTFTNDGFGTVASNSFFSVLQSFMLAKATLASPTGFEPVLPP